jgi:hypothetical protein
MNNFMFKEKPITNLIASSKSCTSGVVRERVVMESCCVSYFRLNLYVEARVDEELLISKFLITCFKRLNEMYVKGWCYSSQRKNSKL